MCGMALLRWRTAGRHFDGFFLPMRYAVAVFDRDYIMNTNRFTYPGTRVTGKQQSGETTSAASTPMMAF